MATISLRELQRGKELHKDQTCREAETLKKVPQGRGLPPGHVLGLALFWGLQEPESGTWGCSRPDRALARGYSMWLMAWVWSSGGEDHTNPSRLESFCAPGPRILLSCPLLQQDNSVILRTGAWTQLKSTKTCQGKETRSPRAAPDLPLDPILS